MARRIIEPTEMPMAKPGVASFDENNEVKIEGASALDKEDASIVIQGDTYGLDEKARHLAFMEEPVTIMIHDTTDPNAEQVVFCAVNGEGAGPHKSPWLPRNQAVTIARKFVGVLCKARPVAIGNVEVLNPMTGEREIRYPRSSALKYPFSVLNDPSPRGAEWLKQQLQMS